ncbi:MAG: DUF484 family protein [Betaproteobacteria bacterium]|uniref:DUF484 family protein n=1 Tax=Candidatus Proximibacter danicus TaxID=2954365 RepID=A0A9D7K4V3_9PROT|nr:DUF484 family protein [Candidatus Proximibacter danicus]
MAQIAIPHPHSGRAISITERQMLALRDKNRQLEAKLTELIGFGEDNDAISEKMQRLSVALITAYTFQAVIHTLGYHPQGRLCHPAGSGSLMDLAAWRARRTARVCRSKPGAAGVRRNTDASLCGSTSGFETSTWFGEASVNIRSQALIALRAGRHYRHDCPRRL